MSGILFVSLGLMILLNVPIAVSIGFASILAIHFGGNVPLLLVVQRMFTGIDSFTLLAIPLFMIAGRLMERGGISRRLIDFAMTIVGRSYGGLANVAVLACMFFSAISGSAPATVVAIGSIMVPAMVRAGYGKAFSASILASAGIIGVIIPPSIPFITYGVTMGTSIGNLFLAGLFPGVLLGGSLMVFCYFYSKKRGWRVSEELPKGSFLRTFLNSIWGLLMPIIILGGIYGGVFTPTESAVVACVYSLFVGFLVYRELDIRTCIKSFYEAGITSSMVLLIISCATVMGWVFTAEQIPVLVTQTISSISDSRVALLFVINGILLITGCFMEPNAAIIILGPLFLPLLQAFDIDLIHFGVIMVVNLAIGMLTPPLGVNLFVANSLSKETVLNDIIKAAIPMLMVLLLDLVLITFLPEISIGLVRIFGK